MNFVFATICMFLLSHTVFGEYSRNEVVLQDDKLVGEVVLTPPPRFTKDQLPLNFDYRPEGLLTTDLNQHIPTYW